MDARLREHDGKRNTPPDFRVPEGFTGGRPAMAAPPARI